MSSGTMATIYTASGKEEHRGFVISPASKESYLVKIDSLPEAGTFTAREKAKAYIDTHLAAKKQQDATNKALSKV
jgi:hypothetical protein